MVRSDNARGGEWFMYPAESKKAKSKNVELRVERRF